MLIPSNASRESSSDSKNRENSEHERKGCFESPNLPFNFEKDIQQYIFLNRVREKCRKKWMSCKKFNSQNFASNFSKHTTNIFVSYRLPFKKSSKVGKTELSNFIRDGIGNGLVARFKPTWGFLSTAPKTTQYTSCINSSSRYSTYLVRVVKRYENQSKNDQSRRSSRLIILKGGALKLSSYFGLFKENSMIERQSY